MIRINTIKNILDLTGRKSVEVDRIPDGSLSAYTPEEYKGRDKNLRVIHNGRAIPRYLRGKIFPKDNDEIIFAIEPSGPTIIPIITFVTALVLKAKLWQALIITALQVAAMLYGDPEEESVQMDSSGWADSVVYGWQGIRNTSRNGQSIPVVYGEHKFGGEIIRLFTRSVTIDKNELYMLIALSEGEIDSVSDIRINGNSYSGYKGVTVDSRVGTNAQTIITGFRDIINSHPVGLDLEYDSAVQVQTGISVDSYELDIVFPGGLRKQLVYRSGPDPDDGTYLYHFCGEIQGGSVALEIQHKKVGGAWSAPETITISKYTASAFTHKYRKEGLALGVYDIKITRKTIDDDDGVPALGGYYQHYADGSYHIGEGFGFIPISTLCKLDNIEEVNSDDLSYPNVALLGVRAIATDQLSGGTPTITSVVKGRKVPIWNNDTPPTFTNIWSDNPAWCLLDIIRNIRYGLGDYIGIDDIDLDSFKELADFCDTLVDDGAGGTHKRCTLNMVFDGKKTAWDAINAVCATARAVLIKTGRKIKVKVEKAESPVQLFTMGNIIKDSFKIAYTSIRDRPNFLEVQFLNELNDYEQDIVSVEDKLAFSEGEDFRKRTVSLYGVTRPAQAYRDAIFHLNINRYLKKMIEFEAGIDSIACEVGDVINFQHDVPQWGNGGRIVSATSNTVTLDESVTIAAGTYKVRIRLKDDTEEEKTVTTGAGTHTVLTISGTWTKTPEKGDLFAFGLENVLVKPFRVIEITRGQEFNRKISALEYNASIYDDSFGEIETLSYSQLPDPSEMPPDVTALDVSERVTVLEDGSLEYGLDVFFVIPTTGSVSNVEVWWRDKTHEAGLWHYGGITSSGYFRIDEGIRLYKTYEVAVASISMYDTRKNPDDAPQAEVTITGQTNRPGDVKNLGLVRVGDTIYLTWDEARDYDLKGYEIRVGLTWGDGLVIGGNLTDNKFSTTNFSPGLQQFMVKAVNNSGWYSLHPAISIVDVDERINQNVILARDEKALGWPGTKDKMTVDGVGDLELDTGETEGSYTTPKIDVGNIVASRVHINYAGLQQDLTTTWADATYAWDSDWAKARAFSGSMEDVKATAEIKFRTSPDDVTWTDWADFVVGEHEFKWIQIKVEVTTEDTDHGYVISKLDTVIDVPDVFDSADDVTVVAAGLSVTFSKTFLIIPSIIILIKDSDEGDFYKESNKSITGFDVHVFDSNGVPKNSQVDWVARGY